MKKLYPNGKAKAVVISFDDGIEDDIRFVKLLNKYHLKGTFNLNSGLMKNEFEWTHESGYVVKRLPSEVVKTLYEGHEVASHSLTHPYLRDWNRVHLFGEISIDKENLTTIFNRKIKGFAIPFDYYDGLVTHAVQDAGFTYMRISEVSHNFDVFKDPYQIISTVFDLEPELPQLVDEFLQTDQELACFMLVGHSYDLTTNNLWEMIENQFKKLAKDDDIISLTTSEYVDYVLAMNSLELENNKIINNSDLDLFISDKNQIIKIPKHSSINLD